MANVTLDDVQAWLTEDRLQLEHSDTLPEEPNVSRVVLSRLEVAFDTSGWTTAALTPSLVRSIISARVAAVRYRKVYADQLEEFPYADWLENWSDNKLEQVAEGRLELTDIVTDDERAAAATHGAVSFLPNDATGVSDPEDAAKFSMGQVF